MKKIYLMTMTGCHKCEATKEWLKEHNIVYEEIVTDIDKYGRHMGYKIGIDKLPVFVEVTTLTPEEFKKGE